MERPVHLLLSDRTATEFRSSRRTYRFVLVGLFALLILLLITFGSTVVRHVNAVAAATMAGAAIDWDLDGSNWTRGGVTRINCALGRGVIADAALLQFKNLHRVVALDLSDCELITPAGLSGLSGLHELETLDLSRTMPVRRFFEADRPPVRLTDEALVPLQNLTRLTNLSLAGDLITDDGLARLSGLTNLEVLDLSGTQVTDKGLKHLKGLKRLKSLTLLGTKVSKEGALELQGTLSALTEFNIGLGPSAGDAEN